MIKYLLVGPFFMCLSFCPVDVPELYAQSSSEEQASEGDAEREMDFDRGMAAVETAGYLHGKVVDVDPKAGTLIIKEDQYNNRTYMFYTNRDTTFVVTSSLRDLNKGDSVQIDYAYFKGRRIAINILLDERAYSNDSQPKPLEKVLKD